MSDPATPFTGKSWSKSDGWRQLKLVWKRLVGREPRLTKDIVVPLQRFGDWWLCGGLLRDGQRAYSFGVGEDISFDLDLIRTGKVDVFAFDPTPNTITWLQQQNLPLQFHFFPWAVADREGSLFLYPRIAKSGRKSRMMYTLMAAHEARDDGIEVPVKSLAGITRTLDHDHIDILKIDIEGAEYGVLKDLLDSTLRPVQVLVEFHHRFPGLSTVDTLQAVDGLRRAGYGLAKISSSGREYTFILKSQLGEVQPLSK